MEYLISRGPANDDLYVGPNIRVLYCSFYILVFNPVKLAVKLKKELVEKCSALVSVAYLINQQTS